MTAANARLLTTLLSLAEDTGSLSDELHFAGRDDAERVPLDHGAANVLRALVLPKAARVLEVGAGFGGLTRYLGEVSATVHAVEADPVRAAATRFRTRDLDTVTVHDKLVAGAFDLVVVQQPYATRNLLDWVREQLSPTGALVVLTASRGVTGTLAAAGLEVQRELLCSPGHEVTRAVRGAQIDTELPRLSAAIAGGPANGLALLCGPGAAALWPAYRLATYFNTAERAAFACTRADVVRTGEGAEVRRVPLSPSPPVGGISVGPWADKVYDAPTMVEVLLDEPERVAELLAGWRDLVREEAARGVEALWDLVPHNVLVDGETLRPIDLEWRNADTGVSEVVERGVLVLADKLADAGWSAAADGDSMRDLAGWLGVLIGLHPSFVDSAMEREVVFSTIGSCGTGQGTDEVRESIAGIWRSRLERTVHGYRSTKVGAGVAPDEDEVAKR
ncbi:methyltransferase [Amycolatopsis sp. NPDC089917]|uniref:methyltransferase n=1 Tax=Amycolatopsis sp. NPDC089917 TaxID=3155187 RepID=UPI00344943C0